MFALWRQFGRAVNTVSNLAGYASGFLIVFCAGVLVFEVAVRLGSKPYVKDGPWWGSRYRRASIMDMICYVGFKNLLIGAALFIVLKSMGLVQV